MIKMQRAINNSPVSVPTGGAAAMPENPVQLPPRIEIPVAAPQVAASSSLCGTTKLESDDLTPGSADYDTNRSIHTDSIFGSQRSTTGSSTTASSDNSGATTPFAVRGNVTAARRAQALAVLRGLGA